MQTAAKTAGKNQKPVREALTGSIQEIRRAFVGFGQFENLEEKLDQGSRTKVARDDTGMNETHIPKRVRPKGGPTVRGKENALMAEQ